MTVVLDARVAFLERAEPGALWLDYIKREGLDIVALARRDLVVAVTHCRFLGRRRFEFGGPHDVPAAVIELHDQDAEGVVDLVAWPIDAPDRFATLLGRLAVLGADQVINPASYFAGSSLRAWRTPLAWLKARATGFVLLERADVRRFFQIVRGRRLAILAEDAAHGYELARAARLSFPHFGFPRQPQ